MADDSDAERLVVLLEARITDFEKNLKKASATSGTEFGKMRRASSSATAGMESDAVRATSRINQALASTRAEMGVFSKNFVAGAVGPIAALVSVNAAIDGVKSALTTFSSIADKAAAAGLDPEFFQGIAYQAKLSGVEIDTVAGALATFAKNAGLAAQNKGRMVSALQALDPTLLRQIQLAGSEEEKFLLVADAIKNAKDQAQAAAIATAAFGDAGEKLAPALRGGRDEIEKTIAKAHELGIIVDDELIARAHELGDQFDTVATIVDTKLKVALVNLAPQLLWMEDRLNDIIDLFAQINDLKDHPGDVVDVLAAGSHSAADLSRLMQQLQREMGAAQLDKALGGGETSGGIRDMMMGGGSGGADEDLGSGPDQRDLEEWFHVRLNKLLDNIPAPPTLNSLSASTKSGTGGPWTGGWGGGALNGVAPDTFDFAGFLDGTKKVSAAASDLTVPVDAATQSIDTLADSIKGALGDAVSSFTSGPITDLDDALGRLLGSFASIGNQNIDKLFSNILTPPAGGSLAPGLDVIGQAVRKGAQDGTSHGLTDFLKAIPGGANTVGAALGGSGIGYQSQSPLIGGLAGAASGAASGGIFGAVIGGIAGVVGGLLGMNQALDDARKTLDQNKDSISEFIAAADAKPVSDYAQAVRAYNQQAQQFEEIAKAAGDSGLVARLQAASAAYAQNLKQQMAIADLQTRETNVQQELVDAYTAQASTIQSDIARLQDFTASIADFRESLKLDKTFSPLNPKAALSEAQSDFAAIVKKAIGGDATAQGQVQGSAQSYLTAARGYLGSSGAYTTVFNQVEAALGRVGSSAATALDTSKAQLKATQDIVSALGGVQDATKSVHDAVVDLKRLSASVGKQEGEGISELRAEIATLSKAVRVQMNKRPT